MKITSTSRRRKGMALIAALVALAVLSVILTVVTVEIVKQRHSLGQRQRQLQAEWLARAGIEFASARLLASPAAFSADNEVLAPDSKVRIAVEKTGADTYKVSVEAAVGASDESPVARDAIRYFRRTDKGGVIRLEAVPEGK